MTDYVREIQKQLIDVYNFPKGENGLPQDVKDGEYPMTIEGKLDHVSIRDGKISCCNY